MQANIRLIQWHLIRINKRFCKSDIFSIEHILKLEDLVYIELIVVMLPEPLFNPLTPKLYKTSPLV